MAYDYLMCDRDQLFLLPVSMREWLPEGHLAWLVIDVVERVDTTAFHARHPNDGVGRPAYNPDMMLALLLYSYCMGVRSSRRVQQLCESDIAYRVICGNLLPDHTTIARFRAVHEEAIIGVFVDVLALCAATGLATLGLIVLDGTKVGADASLKANRSAEAIAEEAARLRSEVERILREANSCDTSEAVLFGTARGDELPADLRGPLERLARLDRAQQELARVAEAADARPQQLIDKAQQAAKEGRGVKGRVSKNPRVVAARAEAKLAAVKRRAEQKKAKRAAKEAQAIAEGRTMTGPPPGDYGMAAAETRLAQAREAAAASPTPPVKVNVTDPDSRIMKLPGGWVQGYNAQAVVNQSGLVIACAVTQDVNDTGQLLPMIQSTEQMLAAAGISNTIDLLVADAGYWNERNATAPGPDRLIATQKSRKLRDAFRQLGPAVDPPPTDATPLVLMEYRLRTPEGAAAYAQRGCTVEPVFGDHKENRGFRRFMRRGLAATHSEWSLMNTTHNLLKLFRGGGLTVQPTFV